MAILGLSCRTPEPNLEREVAKPKFATPPPRTELLSPLESGPRSSTLRSELKLVWPDSLLTGSEADSTVVSNLSTEVSYFLTGSSKLTD